MTSSEFVVEFDDNTTGRQVLIDTGNDSLFLWYNNDLSWDTNPTKVAMHKHAEVDEAIIMFTGEGFFLHGEDQSTVVKTRWKAPCLIWMPSDRYHRIVVTSKELSKSILLYTPSKTPLDAFKEIIGRATSGVEVVFSEIPEETISKDVFDHVPSTMIGRAS